MTSEVERVEEVAKGLTKAQRRGLTDAWRSPSGVIQVSVACSGRTLLALELAGLVNGAFGLTPLGLAVRAYLLAKEGRS